MKKRYLVLVFIFILAFSLQYVFAADVYRSTKIWSEEEPGMHIFFVSSTDIAITEIRFETATPPHCGEWGWGYPKSISDNRVFFKISSSFV